MEHSTLLFTDYIWIYVKKNEQIINNSLLFSEWGL